MVGERVSRLSLNSELRQSWMVRASDSCEVAVGGESQTKPPRVTRQPGEANARSRQEVGILGQHTPVVTGSRGGEFGHHGAGPHGTGTRWSAPTTIGRTPLPTWRGGAAAPGEGIVSIAARLAPATFAGSDQSAGSGGRVRPRKVMTPTCPGRGEQPGARQPSSPRRRPPTTFSRRRVRTPPAPATRSVRVTTRRARTRCRTRPRPTPAVGIADVRAVEEPDPIQSEFGRHPVLVRPGDGVGSRTPAAVTPAASAAPTPTPRPPARPFPPACNSSPLRRHSDREPAGAGHQPGRGASPAAWSPRVPPILGRPVLGPLADRGDQPRRGHRSTGRLHTGLRRRREVRLGLDEWVTYYDLVEDSATQLDELWQGGFVGLVELDELLRDYPDPMGRVLPVFSQDCGAARTHGGGGADGALGRTDGSRRGVRASVASGDNRPPRAPPRGETDADGRRMRYPRAWVVPVRHDRPIGSAGEAAERGTSATHG